MKHVYVYYRINPTSASQAASRIDALLSVMAPHCSHPPRRLSRCEDVSTWMEIYADIADFDTFIADLNAAVATLHCDNFTLGERHLECFSLPPLSI